MLYPSVEIGTACALLVAACSAGFPRASSSQVVDPGPDGPMRCGRCRAYINPFFTFVERGNSFQCNLCQQVTPVPRDQVSPTPSPLPDCPVALTPIKFTHSCCAVTWRTAPPLPPRVRPAVYPCWCCTALRRSAVSTHHMKHHRAAGVRPRPPRLPARPCRTPRAQSRRRRVCGASRVPGRDARA